MSEHDDYADGDPAAGRSPPVATAVRVLAVAGALLLLAYLAAAAVIGLLTH
jgi:hypothetical protein